MSTLFAKSRANPFDKTAIGAKIPDGKATVSNPIRVQTAAQWTCPPTDSKSTFLFFAGLTTGLVGQGFSSRDGLDTTVTADASKWARGQPYNNHVVVTNNGTNYTQQPAQSLEKWRVVSQAMRLQLINNADENDGWFEAIRIDPSITNTTEMNKFYIQDTTVSVQKAGSIGLVGVADTDVPFTDSLSWASHPTYVSGKLRDIHQIQWKLNSITKDHDFQPVFNRNDIFDPAYDMVAIRIYGRTGGTGGTGTKLQSHVVCNQELQFDEQTLMATAATPGHGQRRHLINSAGDMMTPGTSVGQNKFFGFNRYNKRYTGRRYYRRPSNTRTYGTYRRVVRRRAPVKRTTKRYVSALAPTGGAIRRRRRVHFGPLVPYYRPGSILREWADTGPAPMEVESPPRRSSLARALARFSPQRIMERRRDRSTVTPDSEDRSRPVRRQRRGRSPGPGGDGRSSRSPSVPRRF